MPRTTSGPPDGSAPITVRAQLLATEHWSLLASRNLTWSESFNRAGWFLTVVSAAVVALALVANTAGFEDGLRPVALVVLPLLIAIGTATVMRLAQLNAEDVHLVAGMNRLRRGYLDLAPELEQYFVTGHTEDLAGLMQTYGSTRTRIPAIQYLSSIALLVGLVWAVLIGAFVALVTDALDAGVTAAVLTGTAGALVAAALLILVLVRHVDRSWGPGARSAVGRP